MDEKPRPATSPRCRGWHCWCSCGCAQVSLGIVSGSQPADPAGRCRCRPTAVPARAAARSRPEGQVELRCIAVPRGCPRKPTHTQEQARQCPRGCHRSGAGSSGAPVAVLVSPGTADARACGPDPAAVAAAVVPTVWGSTFGLPATHAHPVGVVRRTRAEATDRCVWGRPCSRLG